jgi:hypothetical protein
MFEYQIQMQGGLPKLCNRRPTPFTLRRELREQIEEMVKNDILEVSHSPYDNPLTIIERNTGTSEMQIAFETLRENLNRIHFIQPDGRVIYYTYGRRL